MSNVSIAGYASWLTYDMVLIVSLLGWPVYDPNPLRPNPNQKKYMSGSQVGSNIDTPTHNKKKERGTYLIFVSYIMGIFGTVW